jgi:hypothetical protein
MFSSPFHHNFFTTIQLYIVCCSDDVLLEQGAIETPWEYPIRFSAASAP